MWNVMGWFTASPCAKEFGFVVPWPGAAVALMSWRQFLCEEWMSAWYFIEKSLWTGWNTTRKGSRHRMQVCGSLFRAWSRCDQFRNSMKMLLGEFPRSFYCYSGFWILFMSFILRILHFCCVFGCWCVYSQTGQKGQNVQTLELSPTFIILFRRVLRIRKWKGRFVGWLFRFIVGLRQRLSHKVTWYERSWQLPSCAKQIAQDEVLGWAGIVL